MSQKKQNQEAQEAVREFVIGDFIYNEKGLPFKSKKEAETYRSESQLDSVTIVPEEIEAGAWILKKVHAPEEYWWVRFNAKAKPTDTDDVQLSVEGETLVMQREKPICLPERFLECADHARYPHFQQLPNKPRKIVAWIMTYPYQKIRKGTKEEFETMLKQGTQKLKADIKRFGYDLDPEDVGDEMG